MTLAGRLSAFLLTALAAVLICFSVATYALVRADLRHRLDSRLRAAVDTLEASIDVEAEGLEWEPADRRLGIGLGDAPDDIRYAVRDGPGQVLDLSPNARGSGFPASWLPTAWPDDPPDGVVLGSTDGWRLAVRRLRLADLSVRRSVDPDPDTDNDIVVPVMILSAGVSPAPGQASLGRLAVTLAALSTAIWLLAAAIGQRLARRVLRPLRRMADAARAMSEVDDPARLPEFDSRDEIGDLARTFNDLLGRRQAAYEQQRRLAAEASHQLRTPLAGLIAQVDVTRRRPRDSAEYEASLDRVRRDAVRLQQVVESLLLLSRPDDPATRPAMEDLDLTAWLPELLSSWRSHPRAADLDLRCDGSTASKRVHTNPNLLAQLLGNLIDNALKYSPSGTTVPIRVEAAADRMVVSVRDQGPGLDPVERSQVFEPFYRSSQARRAGAPGVGLGLAVASRLAATIGAALEVISEPGQGACFRVGLPVAMPAGSVAADLP
jgi:signal transduction histidine kinase